MNFKEYIADAWASHAEDPRKVAYEFKQNFQLMESEEDVTSITRLIVHVCGEHLGEWMLGIDLLRKLKNNAKISDPSEMNRYMAILNLGNNPNTSIENFSASDQARIYVSTASALANLGGIKIADKFLKLTDEIATTRLSKEDPALKTISLFTQSIASSFASRAEKTTQEIELLNLATTLAQKYNQ
jgi:hypothetical protein